MNPVVSDYPQIASSHRWTAHLYRLASVVLIAAMGILILLAGILAPLLSAGPAAFGYAAWEKANDSYDAADFFAKIQPRIETLQNFDVQQFCDAQNIPLPAGNPLPLIAHFQILTESIAPINNNILEQVPRALDQITAALILQKLKDPEGDYPRLNERHILELPTGKFDAMNAIAKGKDAFIFNDDQKAALTLDEINGLEPRQLREFLF
jgi:hypothetical protein